MNPFALVGRMAGIRRIAEHDHHRVVLLRLSGFGSFAGQCLGEQGQAGQLVRLLKRVCQIHPQPLVRLEVVAGLSEL